MFGFFKRRAAARKAENLRQREAREAIYLADRHVHLDLDAAARLAAVVVTPAAQLPRKTAPKPIAVKKPVAKQPVKPTAMNLTTVKKPVVQRPVDRLSKASDDYVPVFVPAAVSAFEDNAPSAPSYVPEPETFGGFGGGGSSFDGGGASGGWEAPSSPSYDSSPSCDPSPSYDSGSSCDSSPSSFD